MKYFLVVLYLFNTIVIFAQNDLSKKEHLEIYTKDIDNFWIAYDMLESCDTWNDSLNCINQFVFSNGTAGFSKFISKYQYSAEDYLNALNTYPNFYKSIRKNTYKVKTIKEEMDVFFDTVKTFYPNYSPLKICFVISPVQCGGTVFGSYLFIGAEIITSTKENDLSDFGESALSKILAFETNIRERLIFVIAHETVHDLQIYADFNNNSLLNKSLEEGAADFIAELLTGSRANHYLYNYGDLHEEELKISFLKDVENGANTDDWMFNFDRIEGDIPADLGYYMGYKIVKTYYNNSTDKKKAIYDIIEIKNPHDFLENSFYYREE